LVTTDEHRLEAEELCAGEMRLVCWNGAFRHVCQSRDLVSGVRRKGQHLRDATGRAMPEMRGRGATRRIAFVPDLLRHGLVAGGLQLTNKRTRDGCNCSRKRTQALTSGVEMKEYRHECGGGLRLRDLRCPYCHQSTLNWQHVLVAALVAATAIFYLLRVF
jgi:hypothetical protein